MAGLELLSDQGIRMDGRRPNELRKIECKLGVSEGADGSAYFQQGNTTVLATVYGPHEISGRKSKALADRALKAQEMSNILKSAFESTILTSLYPGSQIDLFFLVLHADGGNCSACINAGTLALINAGIPLKDYLCACSAGFVNETPLMDINHFEGFLGGTELNLAILKKSELIACDEMTERLHTDHIGKIRKIAIQGCKDIYAILDAAHLIHQDNQDYSYEDVKQRLVIYFKASKSMNGMDEDFAFPAFLTILLTMIGLFWGGYRIAFSASMDSEGKTALIFSGYFYLWNHCLILIPAALANEAANKAENVAKCLPYQIPAKNRHLKFLLRKNLKWNNRFSLWEFYVIDRSILIASFGTLLTYGIILGSLGKELKKGGADPHHIKRSLRKGTWFQGSHLSFGLILRLTYMWLNKIPQESIINDLGIASQTASEWKNFCKEVCLDYCLRFDGQIGGTGLTVDIYEAWLSEKKYKIERRAKGNSVFVGLVRHLNDFFVEVVEDRSAEVLIEVIIKRIIPGSTILINCGSLYSSSRSLFEQLEVLHNVTIKETQQSSEGIWFKVKLALQGNEFLDGEFNTEVAEYIWRRRNNYIMTQKVQNFLKTISESFPPKSKD
ncbi:Exosome complex component RRP41 like protein [Argiope bruennichi]|uniref:Exosome complex component RRP41 like protein n=1 Tax=Argiope bruennichi TaxID=94029 RepID=A0A8T0EGU3_ARGBR|nr:Exosome complex component RRP41 like protein [Argiope bruennichi]